jgi:hypothetical protein
VFMGIGGTMGRGLSTLQKDIMAVAASKGYCTPHEAVELAWQAWDFETGGNLPAVYAASASRALARLERRGLLVRQHLSWAGERGRRRTWVYRLPAFSGKYQDDVALGRMCHHCRATEALEKLDPAKLAAAMSMCQTTT